MKKITIGNAQAFWGDSPLAPAKLLQQENLDYLTLDYLAEVSLSIMAIQREKDPQAGFARDFLDVIASLIPLWKKGHKAKVITNAGGLNPLLCAEECRRLLKEASLPHKVGTVTGDDVLAILDRGENLETGEPLGGIKSRLVTANAYLGAAPIAKSLLQGADIVITGRVADPSLTVAPCLAEFGWKNDNYDAIAGATVAGHLIECGTQVTGGISTHWLEIPDPTHLGFPFVEISDDGSFVITKPKKSSGQVNIRTVKEQLLYEIGDPDNYLSPDATVSFLSLKLKETEPNRVEVTGASGRPPPTSYKVSATFRDGYKAEAMLGIFGPQAAKKAKLCGNIILDRVKEAGFTLENFNIECLGAGGIVPGLFEREDLLECVLRIAVRDSRKEAVECFTKEIAPLVTSGPQGVVGYTSGRPSVWPVFGYWPCLIPTDKVKVCVT